MTTATQNGHRDGSELLLKKQQVDVLANSIKENADLFSSLLQERVLIKDVHFFQNRYGGKPTLTKAGAIAIMQGYHWYSEPEEVIGTVFDHENNYYAACIKSKLYNSDGKYLGSGYGFASSKEERYAMEEVVEGEARKRYPDEGLFKTLKVIQRKNGKSYLVPRVDLASQVNTIIKMAHKSADIAAVMNVTAASAYFTQDVDDIGDIQGFSPVSRKDLNTLVTEHMRCTVGEMLTKLHITEEILDYLSLDMARNLILERCSKYKIPLYATYVDKKQGKKGMYFDAFIGFGSALTDDENALKELIEKDSGLKGAGEYRSIANSEMAFLCTIKHDEKDGKEFYHLEKLEVV